MTSPRETWVELPFGQRVRLRMDTATLACECALFLGDQVIPSVCRQVLDNAGKWYLEGDASAIAAAESVEWIRELWEACGNEGALSEFARLFVQWVESPVGRATVGEAWQSLRDGQRRAFLRQFNSGKADR